MDWLITKVYDYQNEQPVEDKSSQLYGFSALSGGGSYIISSRLDEAAVNRAVDNACYPFLFKVVDSNDCILVEGLSDNCTTYKPLRHVYNSLTPDPVILSIQFYEDGELVNVITLDEMLEDEEDSIDSTYDHYN